jgi:hypothetical protein
MSDATIAEIARRLAGALDRFARERADGDRKSIAMVQTELCQAVREEKEDAQASETQAGWSAEAGQGAQTQQRDIQDDR